MLTVNGYCFRQVLAVAMKGGQSLKEAVKRMTSALFTNRLCRRLNWSGGRYSNNEEDINDEDEDEAKDDEDDEGDRGNKSAKKTACASDAEEDEEKQKKAFRKLECRKVLESKYHKQIYLCNALTEVI
jgi:hypothetical protein